MNTKTKETPPRWEATKVETKYTPGPWMVDGGYVISKTETLPGGASVIIADPFEHEMFVDNRQLDANAKLIAAAPDLLEALQDIVYQAQRSAIRIPADLADSIRVFGRAAIAKATK
jgi:hypothetical protein